MFSHSSQRRRLSRVRIFLLRLLFDLLLDEEKAFTKYQRTKLTDLEPSTPRCKPCRLQPDRLILSVANLGHEGASRSPSLVESVKEAYKWSPTISYPITTSQNMSPDIQSNSIYFIINRKGGTVINLSGEDNLNKSIIGYPRNGGKNQQWEPMQIDGGWIIKSVSSGHYLGYQGSPCDGNKLVATDQPFVWNIWRDIMPFSYRISVPNSNQDVDLSDHGNATPGTPIATWGRWEGLNQVWAFEQVR